MNPMLTVLAEGFAPAALVGALLLVLMQWVTRASQWRVLLIMLVLALIGRYLAWRIFMTLPPMADTVDFIAGVIFLAIELFAVVGSVMAYITLSRTRDRSGEADANMAWFASRERAPLVDVFICTYNEEREIVEKTMIGALAMTYPNFRVWVLDDGRREWLAELAHKHGCYYLARPDNRHAKAGNINHALRHVAGLDQPPDYVSILDADFVPMRHFLRRVMPLFRDDDVGIVQTPQHFINPDPIQANLNAADVWPDEQRYFFEVLMPSKDAWGTAFCCGTSSVIRMPALARAGGLPTDSVTEDYLLTLRLKRHGYRTIYLNEQLSLGLAPEGLKEYITQRSRWALGFAQIVRGTDGPFRPRNGLELRDRLSLIETMLYWSAAYIFRVAGLVVPILYLLFDIRAVDVDVTQAIAYFFPAYLTQIVVISWLSGHRALPVMTDVAQLLSAREIITAFFIGLVRPKGHKFKVTAKGGDRSKMVVQWNMMAWFGLFLVLTLGGIIHAFGSRVSLQDSSALALYWSWYNIIVLTVAMLVCIERPRLRHSERLRGALDVHVLADGRVQDFRTADISLGGLRVVGAAPASAGAPITFEIDNMTLTGRIVRVSPNDFAIAVDKGADTQMAMMRLIYSGGLENSVQRVRKRHLAKKLAYRVFE